MAVNKLVIFGLAWVASACAPASLCGETPPTDVESCAGTVNSEFRSIGLKAPRFADIGDAARWVISQLPAKDREHFARAGRDITTRTTTWIQVEAIHEPFGNAQLMSELLWSQYFAFAEFSGCQLKEESGVVGEVIEDELYFAFVKKMPLEDSLRKSGIRDLAELRRALFFAMLLESSEVNWDLPKLSSVLAYRPQRNRGF